MIEKMWDSPLMYRIEVPLPDNPLRYLNSYVVCGSDRWLVIDTGFNREECREALFSGLSQLQVDLARTDLFLTHLHADHTGLVGDFAGQGCQVYMNGDDYQYLVDSALDGRTWKYTEQLFMKEGMPPKDIEKQFSNQARKFSPDPSFSIHPVGDGDVVTLAGVDFQVIHTPGHTKGLSCLWLPKEGLLVSSDHVLFDITPNIQRWQNLPDALACYLHSLDKVRDLPARLVLPGHRKASSALKERVDAIKAHHANRLQELWQAAKDHPGATAFELAPHLTWSMRGKKWPEFPPTQKWFAMGETLSHVEYLLHHGRLEQEEKNGLYIYYAI